jgi:hypothetical protein
MPWRRSCKPPARGACAKSWTCWPPRPVILRLAGSRFAARPAVKRLLHFVKEEKPFFGGRLDPRDLRSVICVRGKHTNLRIFKRLVTEALLVCVDAGVEVVSHQHFKQAFDRVSGDVGRVGNARAISRRTSSALRSRGRPRRRRLSDSRPPCALRRTRRARPRACRAPQSPCRSGRASRAAPRSR